MPFKPGWNKKDKKPEVKTETIAPAVAPIVPVVESPKFISFYIEKEKGLWRLNLVELQDNKVISKKTFECENKAHALEKFKIKFAETYFIGK